LVTSHTDVDRTGKSYYGETGLHLLQSDGKFEANVVLKKEGTVHDASWHPNGKEFVVVYGTMPAQTTLFDSKCQPIADYGSGPKNTAKFSPNGRLLCIGGFGNVSGNMDIWDPKKLKKLASIVPGSAAHYEWAPDSRHIITAILSPRLRVDNGFKIWSYDGSLVHKESVEPELFQINWKPTPFTRFPDRPPSPRVYSQSKPDSPAQPPAPARYVHPNAKYSSGLTVKKQEDGPMKYKAESVAKKEPPPGFSGEMSKNAQKNAKKRANKKTKQEGEAEEDSQAVPEQKEEQPQKEEPKSETSEADPQKKAKAIQKKLRQIDEIKQQQAGGKQLDQAQMNKLATEKQLRDDLKKLNLS